MILDEAKAMDIVETPKSKDKINSVKEIESQLRVFTEAKKKNSIDNECYWAELLSQMKNRSNKKFKRIQEFIRYPLPIVQITGSILTDFNKVFEGKNRYFSVDANREIPRLKDWISQNKPADWIEKQARKVFKNKPNSFVVIDVDENGQAYLVYVDSERLVDACFKDEEGNLEYIAFIHSQTKEGDVTTTLYSVYDDTTYFVFSKKSTNDNMELVSSNPHGIGYCPAKSFIRTCANSDNYFERKVAFSTVASDLEDWTLFDIYRNYVDHYAPFPVTEAPVNVCQNPKCQDGKVETEVMGDNAGEFSTEWITCKTCDGGDKGEHIMPGTHIGIKVQAAKDLNDGSGVFRMIFPDTDNMNYVPDKLDKLELKTKFQVVGLNNMSTEAINELQVKGSFASMETILIDTKKELDALYIWIIKTVGKLMYPSTEFYVDANFGTEFYLLSEEELQKRYDLAKKAGMPMEELMMIYIQIIETKYKGNNAKIDRQKMLIQLDPLPLFSVAEAIEMQAQTIIDPFDLTLKVHFLNFIAKFEAENAPITQFGLNLEPWQRIDKIKETLNFYTNERISKSKQLFTSRERIEGT